MYKNYALQNLEGKDIFLNVAGGMKIQEPAADLAVAAAVISSVTNRPLPNGSVFFGEIALSAQIRQVSKPEQRLKESKKLGLNSTPSFVINGYIVKGADLVKIIDAIEYFSK